MGGQRLLPGIGRVCVHACMRVIKHEKRARVLFRCVCVQMHMHEK